MINCEFEHGAKANLRHVTVDTILIGPDGVLLGRRAPHLTSGGLLALPGGYMDRDEDLPQAAARELLEETGWTPKSLTLFEIQHSPDRRGDAEISRQNVSFIFFGEAGELVGEPDAEVTEIIWAPLDALPYDDIAFEHGDTIKRYLAYCESPFALPVF